MKNQKTFGHYFKAKTTGSSITDTLTFNDEQFNCSETMTVLVAILSHLENLFPHSFRTISYKGRRDRGNT